MSYPMNYHLTPFTSGGWSHGGVVMSILGGKLATAYQGQPVESPRIKYGILGELSHDEFLKKISAVGEKALKDNVAVFRYPRAGEIKEIWVFEAAPATAPQVRRGQEELKG